MGETGIDVWGEVALSAALLLRGVIKMPRGPTKRGEEALSESLSCYLSPFSPSFRPCRSPIRRCIPLKVDKGSSCKVISAVKKVIATAAAGVSEAHVLEAPVS